MNSRSSYSLPAVSGHDDEDGGKQREAESVQRRVIP